MQKRLTSREQYFVAAPTTEEFQSFEMTDDKRALARVSPRTSKLDRMLSVIAACLQKGYSLRKITRLLSELHQLSTSPSTLCRFIDKHPLLRQLSLKESLE